MRQLAHCGSICLTLVAAGCAGPHVHAPSGDEDLPYITASLVATEQRLGEGDYEAAYRLAEQVLSDVSSTRAAQDRARKALAIPDVARAGIDTFSTARLEQAVSNFGFAQARTTEVKRLQLLKEVVPQDKYAAVESHVANFFGADAVYAQLASDTAQRQLMSATRSGKVARANVQVLHPGRKGSSFYHGGFLLFGLVGMAAGAAVDAGYAASQGTVYEVEYGIVAHGGEAVTITVRQGSAQKIPIDACVHFRQLGNEVREVDAEHCRDL